MSPSVYVLLALALSLLTVGAYALARGITGLASRMNAGPLAAGVGVALALIAPDAVVSVTVAWKGRGDLAVGNATGSVITYLLLFTGGVSLLATARVSLLTARRDLPLLALSAIALWSLALDHTVDRLNGVLLLAAFVTYLGWIIRSGSATLAQLGALAGARPRARYEQVAPVAFDLLRIIASAVLLATGADTMARGADELARELGLSELIVGLTVISAGTALPALVASLLLAVKGHRELAFGVLITCCIGSVLGALGLSATLADAVLTVSPNALAFDMPVMLAVSTAVALVALADRRLGRIKGVILLAYYSAYLLYLALFSTGIPRFETYRHAVHAYLVPATAALLLAVLAGALVRHYRK